MKKLMIYILFLGLAGLCSCQSNNPSPIPQMTTCETDSTTIHEYIDNNSFIDIDVAELSQEIASSDKAPDKEKMAKMKVALYRFYSHVELVNDHYECHLTQAAEINISKRLFEALTQNLNEVNHQISQTGKDGKDIYMHDIDKNYLQSFLK